MSDEMTASKLLRQREECARETNAKLDKEFEPLLHPMIRALLRILGKHGKLD